MRSARALMGAAGVLGVLLASGCGGGASVQRAGDVVMVTAETSEGMDALFVGTLAVTPSGCLGMAGVGGATDVVPVAWPAGATLSVDDGTTLEVRGERYSVGDPISGGGGEVAALPVEPPPECEADAYLQLWNVDRP